ncbi:hypothetical protein [Flavisphingomonas formosensis]|uniref:hypothetical protein n=1 Tax=Flavisphingomonas formosensis TaxID=861534 RepID=UPI0012F8F641|nr:hypothetical protein [Sphingomonas formosensis]
MITSVRKIALLVGATLLLPAAASASDTLSKRLAAMTPADFESRTSIVNDPLEPDLVISTEKAHRGRQPIRDGLADNVYVRALVARDTGAVRFQIWHDIAYWGQRKELYQVNYVAGGALKSDPLAIAAHRADECPFVDEVVYCKLNKTLVFEVSEPVMREIAQQYQPASRDPWSFRFKDRLGRDVTSGIAPAEAAGLLRVLDKVRSAAAQQHASL